LQVAEQRESIKEKSVSIPSLCDVSTIDTLPVIDDNDEFEWQRLTTMSPRSMFEFEGSGSMRVNESTAINTAMESNSIPPCLPIIEQSDNNDIDGLIAQLDCPNAATRNQVLTWVIEQLWPLSCTPCGCRLVQKAIQVADISSQRMIAEQLHGCVLEASASPHANHVLQKCISTFRPDDMRFVMAEIKGNAAVVARHRYGCRVIERLIEHSPWECVEPLIDEMFDGVEKLCRHAFGNFVIQCIMEHGRDHHRQQVAEVLCTDAVRFAKHRVASHVVKAALSHCGPREKHSLIQALNADPAEFLNLAHHHCGSFVVRELRRNN
jgi:hypothetical protein